MAAKLRLKRQDGYPRLRAKGQSFAPQDDLYHWILVRPWGQFLGLVALGFFAINLLFGFLYWLRPGSVANAPAHDLEHMFYFSVQTFATIGYGAMAPADRYAQILVSLEAVTGMLTVAMITGLTFAKFARPSARVLFSERLVVSRRDGVPHLMVRMANWRHNAVLEAALKITILIERRTQEGDVMRWPLELPLVRDRTSNFFMTWTAMHKIDEQSPLYGAGALDRLREKKAEIFLALTGVDETTGQTVHARRAYRLDDIAWNARFRDVLSIEPDGTRVLDYAHFHAIEPEVVP